MDFEIDPEIKQKIEEAVLEILNTVDMEETTEFKVRSMAAEKLGLDLSVPERKRFVRHVVESFLLSKKDQEQGEHEQEEAKEIEEVEEEAEGEEEEEGKKKREFDEAGDLIICRLSNKRRVTVQEFKGKTLVSIREYYDKDGKELPSSKGISLTPEQWEAFCKAVPKIEDAIKQLEDI